VYPVADALHARRIPFLFATGYDELSIVERYRSIPRVEKPVEVEALVRELSKLNLMEPHVARR
jgi:hypothetical protein